MVVCQYFLKGDCRFGDKCRYEHPSAKNKTVCPHFINGNCRFGDKCWNEHPTGRGSGGFVQQQSGGFRQGNSSRGGQWGRSYHNNQNRFEALSSGPTDTFGGQHPKATDSEQTISQIQKTIENDMDIWEKSKQWPLSCYTYTKEEPCLQGLLDFSSEEIRFEAYKANTDGKADSYQQGLKDLISANQLRRHKLSQMSVSQIQEEIKKTKLQGSPPVDAGSSMQQTSAGAGTFGGSHSFGQSGGSFGGSSSLIQSSAFSAVAGASNQSGNLFGSGNATSQTGLFGSGNTSQSGLLGSGNATSQSGLFGSGNATSQSGLFGSGNATSQSGLFGSGNATSQSGLFGSGNATSQSGIFGQSSVSGLTGSVFGSNTNSTNQPSGMTGISSSSTATNQSGGLFGTTSGQSATSGGLFGSASPTTSSGLFGSGPQLQKNSGTISASHTSTNSMKSTQGTSSSTEQSTVVTPVSLTCSEEDMQAFMADSFVLGKIPECPPPIELC